MATVDQGLVIVSMLHEIYKGPQSTREMARLSEEGGFVYHILLVTDAMNLIHYLRYSRLKFPAERSFVCHCLWLRERIQRNILDAEWTDTRDQTVDGHTKGSISRNALRLLAHGVLSVTKERVRVKVDAEPIPGQAKAWPTTELQPHLETEGESAIERPYQSS